MAILIIVSLFVGLHLFAKACESVGIPVAGDSLGIALQR